MVKVATWRLKQSRMLAVWLFLVLLAQQYLPVSAQFPCTRKEDCDYFGCTPGYYAGAPPGYPGGFKPSPGQQGMIFQCSTVPDWCPQYTWNFCYVYYGYGFETTPCPAPPLCVAGSFSTDGRSRFSSPCSQCGTGWYSASEGATACSICAAGTYWGGPGLTSGATSCNLCPAGKYGISDGAASVQACLPCAAGMNTISAGASACIAITCSEGSFLGPAGTCQACTSCQPGQYSANCGGSNQGTCTQCLSCPLGQYNTGCGGSHQGTCTQCLSCPLGQYNTGCDGFDQGRCKLCSSACPGNQTAQGCGGLSLGVCVPIQVPETKEAQSQMCGNCVCPQAQLSCQLDSSASIAGGIKVVSIGASSASSQVVVICCDQSTTVQTAKCLCTAGCKNAVCAGTKICADRLLILLIPALAAFWSLRG